MIIGITGKIGSGKSTLASFLQTKGYEEYSMASPLKEIGKIFGFTNEQLYGTQEEKLKIHPVWGISSREFLQKVGTELFRDALPKAIPDMKIKTTVWAELFRIRYTQDPKPYVISDVRFLDEARVIKELGGKIIRVDRNNDVLSKNQNETKHKSETEQDEIKADYKVNKNILSIEQSNRIIEEYLNLKRYKVLGDYKDFYDVSRIYKCLRIHPRIEKPSNCTQEEFNSGLPSLMFMSKIEGYDAWYYRVTKKYLNSGMPGSGMCNVIVKNASYAYLKFANRKFDIFEKKGNIFTIPDATIESPILFLGSYGKLEIDTDGDIEFDAIDFHPGHKYLFDFSNDQYTGCIFGEYMIVSNTMVTEIIKTVNLVEV